MRKIIAILVIILLLIFTLFFFQSDNKYYDWASSNTLIAHAFGGIAGKTYTNSLDAFEFNYSNGFKVYEVDLTLTSDNQLVLRHDWSKIINQHLGQEIPSDKLGIPLSLDEFKSLKIHNYMEPVSYIDTIKLMSKYKDIYIVTDTKDLDPMIINQQFEQIVNVAKQYNPTVLNRIIPQIYTEEMYSQINKIFSFDSYIYTLYQTSSTEEEIIEFMTNNNLKVVAMPPYRVSENFINQLSEHGIYTYVHTINTKSEVEYYNKLGVHGYYTDFLTPNYYDFITE